MPDFRQLSFELPGFIDKTDEALGGQPPGVADGEGPPLATTRAGRGLASPPRAAAGPMIAGGRGLVFDPVLSGSGAALVRDLGLPALAARLKVCWNTRLITTAGLAHHGTARIDLNPRLEEFQPEEPRRTMLHELAHLVAHSRARGRRIQPHGPEWRRACAELGIPGESRCHNLPLARRSVRRRFAYRCRHCGTVVPRVRKLSRESACYPCCRSENGGRYSRRFLLEPIALEEARLLAPEHRWA